MVKRKKRVPEPLFIKTTESLTDRHKELDKLRTDLWVTTDKQLTLVKKTRNEIPDCRDAAARCVVHEVTDLLNRRIQQIQTILEGTVDHSIHLYITNSKKNKKSRL
ncbi:hypothetical protein Plhal304r1_c004g0014331 [Plasmopara halstedii]